MNALFTIVLIVQAVLVIAECIIGLILIWIYISTHKQLVRVAYRLARMDIHTEDR